MHETTCSPILAFAPRALVGVVALALAACAPLEPGERLDVDEAAASTFAVVGGRVATPAELYSTVGLAYAGDGLGCTGTLISPTVVVSAAHCVRENNQTVPASQLQIFAGALDGRNPQASQLYDVAAVHPHPNYTDTGGTGFDADGVGTTWDISVIVLAEPITVLTPTSILPLAQVDSMVPAGSEVTVSGYGVTNVQTDAFGVLNIAEVPYEHRSDTEFLAGDQSSPDTCYGDSGGPVYVMSGGQRFLLGATSRGAEGASPDCGGGGIYTLVPAFADWIDDAVGGDPGQPDPNLPVPEGGSCAGSCGGPGSDGQCFCDDMCAQYGDCCADYGSACLGEDPGPGPGPGDPAEPGTWSCPEEFNGDGYCDCGCGAPDADCPAGTLEECEYVNCAEGVEPNASSPWLCGEDSPLVPGDGDGDGDEDPLPPGDGDGDNEEPESPIKPPDTWTCLPTWYLDGICHCGCGGFDDDCATAGPESCLRDGCLGDTSFDPDDPTQCIDDAGDDDEPEAPTGPGTPPPGFGDEERPDLVDEPPAADPPQRGHVAGSASSNCAQSAGSEPVFGGLVLLLGAGLVRRRRR